MHYSWEYYPYPHRLLAKPDHSKRLVTAGILLIITALLGLLTVIFIGFLTPAIVDGIIDQLNETEGAENIKTEDLSALMYACAVLLGIFSIFALLGGVYTIKRKRFSIGIVGACLGILSCGLLIIGPILSIIALILIISSKDEYESRKSSV